MSFNVHKTDNVESHNGSISLLTSPQKYDNQIELYDVTIKRLGLMAVNIKNVSQSKR